MSNNIYKPTLPKTIHRLAAFLIDAVIFVVLLTGGLYLASVICNFDAHNNTLQEYYKSIGYMIYNAEKEMWEYISSDASNYESIVAQITSNQAILDELYFVNTFSMRAPLIVSAIVLLIVEFIIPLFLKNGTTVGMKCFHIGLISKNDLAITPIQLFARCLIGKIAILGIIPILGLLYIFLSPTGGLLGTIMVLLVYGIQLVLLLTSKNKTGIQDIIASVYPVDSNETIFYKNKKEKDAAYNQLSRNNKR